MFYRYYSASPVIHQFSESLFAQDSMFVFGSCLICFNKTAVLTYAQLSVYSNSRFFSDRNDFSTKKNNISVPIVAQEVKNPTGLHADVGSIPGLSG